MIPAVVLFLASFPGLAAPGAVSAPAQTSAVATIQWRSFDGESLLAAKKDGKLILMALSVPWGHWDRVMAEVTWTDPRIIALVNERFIPVAVDALVNPDLFTRYGMGGWPTTALVLPTGQPLYYADPNGRIARAGGAYYSADSLVPFLSQLADQFARGREAAEMAAEEIAQTVIARKEVGKAPLTADLVEASVTLMLEAHASAAPDPTIKVSRLPDADSALLAFAYFIRRGNREVLDTALTMLAEMARGGIHDQIGGGFHRLAADAAWRVPSFEKLLVTNAELLTAYADAHQLTQHPRYKVIADGIATWVMREMRDPSGWFLPYEAADARLGDDGDYYTWTLKEAKAALTEETAAWMIPAFDIGEWGEMSSSAPRRNVLHLSEGPLLLSARLGEDEAKIAAGFEAGRRQLLEAREKRSIPPAGKTLVTDANAAMAAALIRAGEKWDRTDLTAAGMAALEFAWEKGRDPESGLMHHIWSATSGRGGLANLFSDQVQMTLAFLAAWESTGDARHRDRARDLAEAARARFGDSLNGGWMDRIYADSAPGLLAWPTRQLRDNALFAEALLRIGMALGAKDGAELTRASRKGLESWADEFAQYREASAPYGLAVLRSLNQPIEIFVAGSNEDAGWETLRDAARALYHPWRIMRYVTRAEAGAALRGSGVEMPEGPAVFFCFTGACSAPYGAREGLRAKMWEFVKAQMAQPAAAEGQGAP